MNAALQVIKQQLIDITNKNTDLKKHGNLNNITNDTVNHLNDLRNNFPDFDFNDSK